jgi:hypothetical protein
VPGRSLGMDMGQPGTAKRSSTRTAGLGLCSAILSMLVGGCGASTRDATAEAKPTGPLYSERAAAAVADALLAAVPLPADTQHVSEPPGVVAGKLGRPINIDEAKAVDRYAYWSSTERPQAMLSFLAKKGPIPKVQYSGYGGRAGKTEGWSETLYAPSASPLAGPRQLFVSIALDGPARYAVRVDVVVAWHKPRPASSLVPATARRLKVTITTPAYRAMNPGEPSHAHTTTRSVTTTASATVSAVARAINELPVAELTRETVNCPDEGFANTVDAPRFRLTFRTSASAGNLARVTGVSGYVCERGGADTAKITTPEDPQGVQLTDHLNTIGPPRGDGLTEHIELAFHHALHLVPEA